jgi:hypothetical protein
MAKRMLNNPVSGNDSFREVFVTTPDVLLKIADLEAQLVVEKAKPPIEITKEITVEKLVFRDDSSLLLKYNQAMKELGILKRQEPKIQQVNNVQEVVRLVYVNATNKKHIAMALSFWPIIFAAWKLLHK